METIQNNPAFIAFALASIILCVNMIALWVYSGLIRGSTRTVINPEDLRKGLEVVVADPPQVARVLRAHANAMGAIVPFLALGLLFVLLGGPASGAYVIFGAFVVARLAHSVTYLRELQPWRTITFVIGLLASLVLVGYDVVLLTRL